MAISNRDLDVSEQRKTEQENMGAVGQSVLRTVCNVAWPCTLEQILVSAQGLSSVSTVNILVQRFIAGSGSTSIAGGATALTVQNVGTSGVQSMVLAAAGSTLLSLNAKDCIQIVTSGAGAVTDMQISCVLKALQDQKSFY